MRFISISTVTHPTAEKLLGILTDFKHYPDWNPYLPQIQGNLREKEWLEITLQPEKGAARKFRRQVIRVEKARLLS